MTAPELKLYNTLTRQKERFEPINRQNVRMYVCGPTVYDHAHIGNARPVIVFDLLFRLLCHFYGADHVTYARNITDVEDKITARAQRDFPDLTINQAIAKITQETTDQFHADVAALGCLEPTHEPRATEHIEGMVAMIGTLLDKGHAYVATGTEGTEVLFDTFSMAQYGQLSNRKLDQQMAGARVAVEAHKRHPGDFVLWKQSSENEPGWPGKFLVDGTEIAINGRPGWHIECSVMGAHHLGETFDIHAGGLDLIFPHHENELAQSRCAHGSEKMANFWLHNGYLQVEGRKMAKSAGNFITIHELLDDWPGEVLRFNMLRTHYRQPIDWTLRSLKQSANVLDAMHPFDAAGWQQAALGAERVISALCDDLNSWQAISEIQKLDQQGHKAARDFALRLLGFTGDSLREHQAVAVAKVDNVTLDRTIADRLALLAEKNFAEADLIRAELAEQGIQLMDYKDPDTGERKTRWEIKR